MESPIARYFKFKFLILVLFLISFILAVLGPFLFSNVYFRICEVVLAYYVVKFAIMAGIMVHNYIRFRQGMAKG